MRRSIALLLLLAVAFSQATFAQDNALEYQLPPEEIRAVVDAPLTPWVSVSPGGQRLLLMERPALPAISELAQDELKLAGVRFLPSVSGPSRSAYAIGFTLKEISDSTETAVTGLPQEPRFRRIRWSPDGQYIAFTHTTSDHVELWRIDVATAKAERWEESPLNAVNGSPYEWLPDSSGVLVKFIPAGLTPPPSKDAAPKGPVVQESGGTKSPARTYQDLLQNPTDELLFEHYFTAQLARLPLNGSATHLLKPAIYVNAETSPDGKYVLIETVHRPYSYLVPMSRFPRHIQVLDIQARDVHPIYDMPLAENIPIARPSTIAGPRNHSWRRDADATLYWVEALDGGDAGKEAEMRDRVVLLPAPFDADPTQLIDLKQRFYQIHWGNDDTALVYDYWWKTRNIRTLRVAPGNPGAEPKVVFDQSWEDRYNDPGDAVLQDDARGQERLVFGKDGESIYLTGDGASPEGNRPFLDELNLPSGESTRHWRSEAPNYERAVELVDPEAGVFLTRRESKHEPPNYFIRTAGSEEIRQVTEFPHPMPQFKDVSKELIQYKREDGVDLNAKLYLPAGYDPEEDGPLPMIMWAYPREYKDASAAGQVSGSPHQFVRSSVHSPTIWLTRGYAVLDGPTMPIIGEGEAEPNDTFVKQLVASAKAAVDEVVRRGVADPNRIAIGGHSYGAFMTANLLAHSDLFATGLARSGAYNRTLTPFGFQSEDRTFWEAPEIYFAMSPFMHADKVNEPILLIHGEADPNPGTFPMQSERYFNALKGHGAKARLVVLPLEGHGYRARESILHMLWETDRWLGTHLKSDAAGDDSED